MNWKRAYPYVYRVAIIGTILGGATPWYILLQLPHWPNHPDATHFVPFNNHGTMRYMGPIEGAWIDHFFWIFFPCFLLVFARGAIRQWGGAETKGDRNNARF